MAISIGQIVTAIATTLETATVLVSGTGVVQDANASELSEGIQDRNTLQVYPEEGRTDTTGNTDRTGFRGGVRVTEITIHCDYYARQRSHIGEDMKALLDGADSIISVLEAQNTKPYFGLDGIKAFAWTWTRILFEYGQGNNSVKYVGVRFIFKITVF